MPVITYVEANGTHAVVDVPEGWSLMQAAAAHGVEGVLGECGGSCACATCHCYLDDFLASVVQAPSDNEQQMLECVVAERRPNSRLACQIQATAAMSGGVVHLPDVQG